MSKRISNRPAQHALARRTRPSRGRATTDVLSYPWTIERLLPLLEVVGHDLEHLSRSAGRMADRLVRDAGTSWKDLLSASTEAKPVALRALRTPLRGMSHVDLALWALSYDALLTPAGRDFLRGTALSQHPPASENEQRLLQIVRAIEDRSGQRRGR